MSAEHPPAQLTLLLTVLPSGNGFAESARSGKYAAPLARLLLGQCSAASWDSSLRRMASYTASQ